MQNPINTYAIRAFLMHNLVQLNLVHSHAHFVWLCTRQCSRRRQQNCRHTPICILSIERAHAIIKAANTTSTIITTEKNYSAATRAEFLQYG